MKTKIIVIVLFAIAILLPAIIMPLISYNVDIWLNEMNIDAMVTADGTLKVVEKWEAEASWNSGYDNLFKEINLYNEEINRKSELKVVKVTDSEGTVYTEASKIHTGDSVIDEDDLISVKRGEYYTAYTYNENEVELGLKMPTELRNDKRSFTLEYEISNFVTKYNDCTEINWKILDNFSVDIKLFVLNLAFENVNLADEFNKAYLHNTGNSWLEFKDNKICVSANKVKRKEMLEVRGVFNNSGFSAIPQELVISKNVYDKITAGEQAQAEAYAAEVKKQATMYAIGITLAVLSVLCAIGGSIWATIWLKKTRKDYPKYVRDVPKDISVGGAGSLFYYYKGGLKNNTNFGNVLAAFMLELASKGYIDFEDEGKDVKIKVLSIEDVEKQNGVEPPKPKTAEDIFGEDFEGVGDFTANTADSIADNIKGFINKWCGEDIFSDNSETQNIDAILQQKYGELKDEYGFYSLLKKVQDFYNGPFTLKQLLGYAKANSASYENEINAIRKDMDSAASTTTGVGKQFSLCIGVQLIFVIICFAMAFFTGYFMVGIISLLGMLGAVLFTPKYKKLSAEREAKQQEIMGIYRFLNEFSALEEKDLKYFDLWEEYMVYATMFGIADKVVAELKVKCPQVYEQMNAMPIYRMFFISHVMGGNSMKLSSFAGSIASTATVVKTINASKHIGGSIKGGHGRGGSGFGGGGRGFGGGGGGFR